MCWFNPIISPMKLWVHWHKTVDSIRSVRVCAFLFPVCLVNMATVHLYLSAICINHYTFFDWTATTALFCLDAEFAARSPSVICTNNAMLRRIERLCVSSWSCCVLVYLLHLFLMVHQVVFSSHFSCKFFTNSIESILSNHQIKKKFQEFFTQLVHNRTFISIMRSLSLNHENHFWICGKSTILVRF